MSEKKEEKKSVEYNKDGSVTIDRDKFDELMNRLSEVEKKSLKGPGVELAEHRLLRNSEERLREEPMMKQQEKITVIDKPAINGGEYLKEKCPYCIKNHKGKPTIQDLTKGGKYACRRCGKHWHSWAIFPNDGSEGPMEYSVHLERGDLERVEEMERIKLARQGLPVTVK